MKKIFKLPARPEDEVEGGLLLDVVVGQSPAILQLLACTDDKMTIHDKGLIENGHNR